MESELASGDQEPSQRTRNIQRTWTRDLMADGWTPVSNYFLEHYAELNPAITTPEAMLIIHLIRHKWNEQPPYPLFKTLGKRMGMTPAAVRGHARKLESKKYLRRVVQVAKPNLFHLEPLFEALEKHREANTPATHRRKQK